MGDRLDQDNAFCVLVTGANAGLGFAICCRLLDEFLATRPNDQILDLIVTTRDANKAEDTIARLRRYLAAQLRRHDRHGNQTSLAMGRVRFHYETLDLLDLASVYRAARRLLAAYRRIDVMVLNAGLGGWTTVKWPLAIYLVLTDLVDAVTWPPYKVSEAGALAPAQRTLGGDVVKGAPPLGAVFCANVFGHYCLTHALMPLLEHGAAQSRIIWLSSIEAAAFSVDDFQTINTTLAYEASKRLTDILALTAHLPSASPWASRYFDPVGGQKLAYEPLETGTKDSHASSPRVFSSHPGIVATSILPLHPILWYAMAAIFYVARWFGSIWHAINPYTAACSTVWLALAADETLDSLESREGLSKWGTATDRTGNERAERTEVAGWGYGGRPDLAHLAQGRKGRHRQATTATAEDRESFETLGRECWQRMEALRAEWEARILGGK